MLHLQPKMSRTKVGGEKPVLTAFLFVTKYVTKNGFSCKDVLWLIVSKGLVHAPASSCEAEHYSGRCRWWRWRLEEQPGSRVGTERGKGYPPRKCIQWLRSPARPHFLQLPEPLETAPPPWVWRHTPLVPALGGRDHLSLSECETSLVSSMSFRTAKAT